MASLRGFFDESDRQDGTEPICVAGFIFRPGAYARFASDWRRFLKGARFGGLSHFHMTDLYAGKRAYEGLGDRRAEIFGRAVEIIRKHVFLGVGALFDKGEYERLAPPWLATLQGSIYTAACQLAMRATAFSLEQHGSYQPVDYSFEAGHKFEAEADAVIRRIAQVGVREEQYRYGTHAFRDKREAAGLQAADIFAWTVARAHVHFPANRTMALLKPHLLTLVQGTDRRFKVHTFTKDSLIRFFEEQLQRPEDFYFRKPPEMRDRLR